MLVIASQVRAAVIEVSTALLAHGVVQLISAETPLSFRSCSEVRLAYARRCSRSGTGMMPSPPGVNASMMSAVGPRWVVRLTQQLSSRLA